MLFYLLAFVAGVFLAVQSGFNTQLGQYLQHPVLATVATSFFSALFGAVFYLIVVGKTPDATVVRQTPWFLWFIGALFSFVGISLYFYIIPHLGISKMIALGLCGQLVFSLVAGHFGWLNLPKDPITIKRAIGAIAMVIGIFLINTK